MGVASGCGEQEVGVASGSGWNLWVWLLGVVLRRYIDFLILLIPTPLVSVLFCSSIYTFNKMNKKVGMLLQKRTDTRGVGISSMRKSIYLLTTTPSSHTHRFHPLPLATPASCSPHPLATPIHSTHSPQMSIVIHTLNFAQVKSMDDNCREWVECIGVASGCGEQEAGVASGSGWNLWVWLRVDLEVEGVRYIEMHRGPAAYVLGPPPSRGRDLELEGGVNACHVEYVHESRDSHVRGTE